VSRLTITPPAGHDLFVTGRGRNIAISPDGTRIAYVGPGGSLLVRPLDSLDATVLVRDDSPVAPFFSPDGRWVGYFPANRALRKVPVDGGPTVVLSPSDGAQAGGATWAEDGTVVFATNNRSTGLLIVAPGGATAKVLTVPDRQRDEVDHLWPQFLPGGRALFFTITSVAQGTVNTQIALFDLTIGQYKTVMPGGSHAHYVPTGHMVYSAAGTLRAAPFDIDRLEAAAAPVTVVSPVLATPEGAADFDVALDGTLVYVPGGVVGPAQRDLVWMDRDLQIEPVRGAPPRPYLYPRISPDGTRLLLDIRDQDNDIWLWDVQRETLTNVTRHRALDRFPVWMPDGRDFIFVSDRDDGRSAIYRQAADGTGKPERLSEATLEQQTPNAVLPDGKQLVFDWRNDLMLLALDGSRRVTPVLQSMAVETRAALSPDGKWLAYHSNESGYSEVYVRPFPMVDSERTQVSTAGGVQPRWSPKGRELFYVTPDGSMMGVRAHIAEKWSSSPPVPVAQGVIFNPVAGSSATFDLNPDGSRFLLARPRSSDGTAAPGLLIVVQNWLEELKRLAPVP
jgi:serine/threonine-protein kinase